MLRLGEGLPGERVDRELDPVDVRGDTAEVDEDNLVVTARLGARWVVAQVRYGTVVAAQVPEGLLDWKACRPSPMRTALNAVPSALLGLVCRPLVRVTEKPDGAVGAWLTDRRRIQPGPKARRAVAVDGWSRRGAARAGGRMTSVPVVVATPQPAMRWAIRSGRTGARARAGPWRGCLHPRVESPPGEAPDCGNFAASYTKVSDAASSSCADWASAA